MCTHRTGRSRPPSPATKVTSRSTSRSRTVSIDVHSSAVNLHAIPGLPQDGPEDRLDFLELLGSRDQRRRELNHRVPAVVGTAYQPSPVELTGEEAAQQRLGFLVRERLLGLLVFDQLDGLEVACSAHVAHDREVA